MRSSGSILLLSWCLVALAACGGDTDEKKPPAPDHRGRDRGGLALRPWPAEDAPDFRHDPGMTGRRFALEQLGAGGAIFDCDGDGDLDILCLNGGPLPGSPGPKANGLFVNDGKGRFTPHPAPGELSDPEGYAVGCAVADFEGDGDQDVFVTRYGRDALFLNDGRGHFTRHLASGIDAEGWSAGAAFGDFDRDGRVDLYVTYYLDYRVDEHRPCFRRDIPIYCGPQQHRGVRDRLYRSIGGGVFRDVTKTSLPAGEPGKGLGVALGDADGDGDLDIYVANDQTPNRLLINDGNGVFSDEGDIAGVAVSRDGVAEAGMGAVFRDLDGDLDDDIVVTNFEDQTNGLYRNEGEGFFLESSWEAGLGFTTRGDLAWGVLAVDLNLDGLRDLVFANGHVYDNAERVRDDSRWAQADRIFLNRGNLRFEEPTSGTRVLKTAHVGRGLASGDLDGDGDPDLVFFDLGERVRLIRNDTPGNGVLVDAVRARAGSTVVGTRVEVTADGKRQRGWLLGSGSYLTHSDPRAHFGLDQATWIERIDIVWPDGRRHRFEDLPVNVRVVADTDGHLRVHAFGDDRVLIERRAR